MILHIVTKKLAEILPKNHALLEHFIMDGNDFNKMMVIFKEQMPKAIKLFDRTKSTEYPHGDLIAVKDHINRTGKNVLISTCQFLDKEFVDVTSLYNYEREGIITNCCGDALNMNYSFPSHHLCHQSVLARAMGIKNIQGYLYNSL